jgi:hypothetical protein
MTKETDPMQFALEQDRKHLRRFADITGRTGVDQLRMRTAPYNIGLIARRFVSGSAMPELADQYGAPVREIEAAIRTCARVDAAMKEKSHV